jgi:hypothetical protein
MELANGSWQRVIGSDWAIGDYAVLSVRRRFRTRCLRRKAQPSRIFQPADELEGFGQSGSSEQAVVSTAPPSQSRFETESLLPAAGHEES